MSNDNGNLLSKFLGHVESGPARTPPVPPPPRVPPPPPPSPSVMPPEQFPSWFNRPVVYGLYYNGKQVPLDGYKFVGCRFDNCTLVVESTNFELVDCVIDPSTGIQYGMETLKVVQLFNSRYENNPYPYWTGFVARKNPDGSITIDGMPR